MDRQQKLWSHLSASICAGCITAANRVAPSNYERTEVSPIAGAKVIAAANVEHIKTELRLNTAPREFVTLKRHYAKLHHRDRKRLAARRHHLRLALRARRHAARMAARRHAAHHHLRFASAHHRRFGIVRARFVPAYRTSFDNRPYRAPMGRPAVSREDGAAYESFFPTLVRLQRD